MRTEKGRIRAKNRRGVRDRKTVPAEKRTGRLKEPAACNRCGAVFLRRVWRKGRQITGAMLDRVTWAKCPACQQVDSDEYWGRVVIRGQYATENELAIRQRIMNVDARAQFTQPERRIISADQNHGVLEILTTSQKLAHRIVHELKKTFKGRAIYKWSEDGSLFAVWERDQ